MKNPRIAVLGTVLLLAVTAVHPPDVLLRAQDEMARTVLRWSGRGLAAALGITVELAVAALVPDGTAGSGDRPCPSSVPPGGPRHRGAARVH